MSADVLTFAPRPQLTGSDVLAARANAQAALWHLSYACNPVEKLHEWHTQKAAEYVGRWLYFARLAAQGGAR